MVSEETREEDEELRHVDLEKPKKVIKPLVSATPQKIAVSKRKKPNI
jgi:hypothetical protein